MYLLEVALPVAPSILPPKPCKYLYTRIFMYVYGLMYKLYTYYCKYPFKKNRKKCIVGIFYISSLRIVSRLGIVLFTYPVFIWIHSFFSCDMTI